VELYYFVKAMLLSPTLFILLIVLGYGVFYFSKFKKASRVIIGVSLGCLLFANGWLAEFLVKSLEDVPPLKQAEFETIRAEYAQKPSIAIVVLGGGKAYQQPKYGSDGVKRDETPRLLYTIWLQKRLGLPLLVSGGVSFKGTPPESEMMAHFVNEFGGRVTWLESESINTWENAENSVRLLRTKGIDKIILVTSAYHMKRALYCFGRQGIAVVPAPTDYSLTRIPLEDVFQKSLPTIDSFRLIRLSLHEYVGLFAYRWNLRIRREDIDELNAGGVQSDFASRRKKIGVMGEDSIIQY